MMKSKQRALIISGLCFLLYGILIQNLSLACGQSRSIKESNATNETSKAVTDPLDLVPSKVLLFAHLQIDGLLKSEFGAEIHQALEKNVYPELEKSIGIPVNHLKSVTLIAPEFDNNAERFLLLFSTIKPYDREKVKKTWESKNEFKKEKLEPDWIMVNSEILLHFRDANTIAIVVQGYKSEYTKLKKVSGSASEMIKKARMGTPFVGYASGTSIAEIIKEQFPAELKPFLSLFGVRNANFFLELKEKLQIEFNLEAENNKQTQNMNLAVKLLLHLAEGEINSAKPRLKESLKKEPNKNNSDNDDQLGMERNTLELVEKSEKLIKQIQMNQKENHLRISLDAPLDSFPTKNLAKFFSEAIYGAQVVTADAVRQNNAKQIMIALHNYHDTHGKFPTAAINGKKGKRLLSWRVSILPFIAENALYQQFKFDEPWDSENNKKLIARMPKVYAFSGDDPTNGKTHFRVFAGNYGDRKLGFDWLQGRTMSNIFDGTSNSIALVEAKKAVEWTKPEELFLAVDEDPRPLLLLHKKKYLFGMFDGSVKMISDKVSKKTLLGALTIDDGMILGKDFE